MFSHPLIIEMMARERHAMLLEAARTSRIINHLKARGEMKPSLQTRVLMHIAEFLIFLGIRLKEKVAPGACATAYTSGSSCNNGLSA